MTTENTTPSGPSVSIEVPLAGHRERAREIIAQSRFGLISKNEASVALLELGIQAHAAVLNGLFERPNPFGALKALHEWHEATLDMVVEVHQPATQG